jgi:acetyl-CoA C-acetyltransferase
MREVVVLSAVRTAIGRYGGALKAISPCDLGTVVVRESIRRARIAADDVDQVFLGNVIHTSSEDMYISRVSAVRAGVPVTTPALTLNRLCGSGLQAIISAAQAIRLGDARTAVAGGVESMSRAPYWLSGLRWGQRMNDSVATDVLVGALTDPFDECHMGITAENIAKKWKISREDQDAFAMESHRRAALAVKTSKFKDQIIPVELKTKGKVVLFETDESPRPDTALAALAQLNPAFDPKGSVTAGNSSSISDGAAALVLMDRELAMERGLKPLGRLVAYVVTGVEPKYMGIGPVSAVRKLLKDAGLTVDKIEIFEVNEAFAAQAIAVCRELGLPQDRVNPNGSGISLGHPIGATGAMLTVKALYQLRLTAGRYALVTMCIGGGQGIAALFEQINSAES